MSEPTQERNAAIAKAVTVLRQRISILTQERDAARAEAQRHAETIVDLRQQVEMLAKDMAKSTAEAAGYIATIARRIAGPRAPIARGQMRITQTTAALRGRENSQRIGGTKTEPCVQRRMPLLQAKLHQSRSPHGHETSFAGSNEARREPNWRTDSNPALANEGGVNFL